MAAGGAQKSVYFAHVDGVRAIAIALVLLFHFELGGATRGYLGVDIFFVVSGFLVGGLVMRAVDDGTFSLAEFYRRRIARILPAFMAVAIATLAVGWLILLPSELVILASGIRAAVLLFANRHFYDTQDYFGPGKHDLHFLHSWSLSIEEQFYILFPLVIAAIAKIRLPRTSTIITLMIGSFCWFIWLKYSNSQASFYWMFARAWELLAGTLLASIMMRNPLNIRWPAASAFIGILLTIVPAFVPNDFTALPNFIWQLASVSGVMLLITANLKAPANIVAQSLSISPIRAIGLISYSLYLIHWPVRTFAGAWSIVPLGLIDRILLLLGSLLLAGLSWRFIETPFRLAINSPIVSTRRLFAISGGLILALAAVTTAIISNSGFPDRLNAVQRNYVRGSTDISPRREDCHDNGYVKRVAPVDACVLGADVAPSVAVWSDSHGVELSYALGQLSAPRNESVLQLTSSSCPPLTGAIHALPQSCLDYNIKALARLKSDRSIRTVVLAQYFHGYENIPLEQDLHGLEQSILALRQAGKRVIIIAPVPYPAFDVPNGLAKRSLNHRSVADYTTITDYNKRNSAAVNALSAIARRTGAIFFESTKALCKKALCPYADGDKPLFFDGHHLSVHGAGQLAAALDKTL